MCRRTRQASAPAPPTTSIASHARCAISVAARRADPGLSRPRVGWRPFEDGSDGSGDDLSTIGANVAPPAADPTAHWDGEVFRNRVSGPHFDAAMAGAVLGWESCDHTGPVHEGGTLYSELHVESAEATTTEV